MHFLYLQECILTSVSAGSRNNTDFSNYCECPDRSCFVGSNKANVVYLVMLLVGQHIIAAEKILQKHCKSTSAIHMLCSCQHHNKDVHNCSYILHPKSKSAF